MIFECGSHNDDEIGSLVQKSGDLSKNGVEQRSLASGANGDERFGPEVADFEDEWNLAGEGEPPSGKSDEELWRRGDDDIGARKSESAKCSRDAERRVVTHALVGFAVGQRPEPGAEDIDAVDLFMKREAAETAAPFGRNDSGGMIGESCEDGDLVSGVRPVACEFGGAGGGRAHLRGEILGEVENFHGQ